jgi:hypothetical protein
MGRASKATTTAATGTAKTQNVTGEEAVSADGLNDKDDINAPFNGITA